MDPSARQAVLPGFGSSSHAYRPPQASSSRPAQASSSSSRPRNILDSLDQLSPPLTQNVPFRQSVSAAPASSTPVSRHHARSSPFPSGPSRTPHSGPSHRIPRTGSSPSHILQPSIASNRPMVKSEPHRDVKPAMPGSRPGVASVPSRLQGGRPGADPSSWENAIVVDDGDSDSEVEILAPSQVPSDLRRKTNKDAPISLVDDDDQFPSAGPSRIPSTVQQKPTSGATQRHPHASSAPSMWNPEQREKKMAELRVKLEGDRRGEIVSQCDPLD